MAFHCYFSNFDLISLIIFHYHFINGCFLSETEFPSCGIGKFTVETFTQETIAKKIFFSKPMMAILERNCYNSKVSKNICASAAPPIS